MYGHVTLWGPNCPNCPNASDLQKGNATFVFLREGWIFSFNGIFQRTFKLRTVFFKTQEACAAAASCKLLRLDTTSGFHRGPGSPHPGGSWEMPEMQGRSIQCESQKTAGCPGARTVIWQMYRMPPWNFSMAGRGEILLTMWTAKAWQRDSWKIIPIVSQVKGRCLVVPFQNDNTYVYILIFLYESISRDLPSKCVSVLPSPKLWIWKPRLSLEPKSGLLKGDATPASKIN